MEFAGTKKIDELERVVIPRDARQALGWVEYTEVEIFICKDAIILERKRPNQANIFY